MTHVLQANEMIMDLKYNSEMGLKVTIVTMVLQVNVTMYIRNIVTGMEGTSSDIGFKSKYVGLLGDRYP